MFPLIFAACKKNKVEELAVTPIVTPPPVSSTLSENAVKDSSFAIAKDIYLWNTQLPTTFNPRNYDDPIKIMEGIRQYSVEPGFSQPVDHYSFAVKKADWDNVTAGMSSISTTMGSNGDFGMTVFFRVEGDLRVRLVEPNSPAGIAGIRRGWRITKINTNSDITTSNSTFIIDNIYNSATSSITFTKPDNSIVTINLNQVHYSIKPVYLDSIYNINNKKIGYLVFNSFLGIVDKQYSEFLRVFTKFAAEGVTEVIMDLRYNGGGYLSVQERLANYLVSASADGGVMMKQTYNATNTRMNVTTKFNKMGGLNLSRVYFIVGKSTASASELLINNLKPYMDVKTLGGTTYGKPVGFSPIPVGDWFVLPVSFRTTNKNGEGNYFSGLTVNNSVADGLDKDWGDVSETSLASAIKNITTGSFRGILQQDYVEPMSVTKGNEQLNEALLKITIDSKK